MIASQNPLAQETVLAESVRRLRAILPAERIYLFGSQARGEATDDSDYDFMVVVRQSALPRYKRDQQAFRALCGLGVPKDVLVLTRKEFTDSLQVPSSLPSAVVSEGILLYAG
ncbi:MAG: nucleotidyltransferase domain-containing protein [Kiritimatiellia bacterium]